MLVDHEKDPPGRTGAGLLQHSQSEFIRQKSSHQGIGVETGIGTGFSKRNLFDSSSSLFKPTMTTIAGEERVSNNDLLANYTRSRQGSSVSVQSASARQSRARLFSSLLTPEESIVLKEKERQRMMSLASVSSSIPKVRKRQLSATTNVIFYFIM